MKTGPILQSGFNPARSITGFQRARSVLISVASVAGGLLYYGLQHTALSGDVTTVICILFIFFIRLMAVRYRISLPAFYTRNNPSS